MWTNGISLSQVGEVFRTKIEAIPHVLPEFVASVSQVLISQVR
jgi:hypothetical protein